MAEENKTKKKLNWKHMLTLIFMLLVVVGYAKAEYVRGLNNGGIRQCELLGGKMIIVEDQHTGEMSDPFCSDVMIDKYDGMDIINNLQGGLGE